MKTRYTKIVECDACKGKLKFLYGPPNPTGRTFTCPYCKGTGTRTIEAVHPSHNMTKTRTEILAPCGTERFYTVRNCTVCGLREESAAAGHFMNDLDLPCKGNCPD